MGRDGINPVNLPGRYLLSVYSALTTIQCLKSHSPPIVICASTETGPCNYADIPERRSPQEFKRIRTHTRNPGAGWSTSQQPAIPKPTFCSISSKQQNYSRNRTLEYIERI
ncbi:hypothetical protein CC2G_014051 [Coprinopsis cinerea AmutBmut pab1-1]|nr:hypothetical protein CC2G_014051 [Coprinopsis cinerea AmutBmut pab1-1]